MTGENKKVNIRQQIKRAEEFLEAAELLHKNGYNNDAVSRLYYFLFHYIKALLFSRDLEPRSHEGALQYFGLHFVKSGEFLPSDSHAFSRLMKYREEGDYNPSYVFTQADYTQFKGDARQLADKIRGFLEARGYGE